ncbi:Transcription termination factor like [Senna tora]|uniref:Transcription termination factor like n=1 Tax=Senna tora TaxID=362788 RepID=A0A835CCW6_9FABA|nr:Transcription termination factor like [Senna tora]
MALFNCYREATLYLSRIATTSLTPILCSIAHNNSYSTSTSEPLSSTANYLVSNLGCSQEIASQVSKHVRFEKPDKSDSVLTLFRSYGFSNSQISQMINARPRLLVAKAHKTILPKLEFLRSKGASMSELVHIVSLNPSFLLRSLENCIVPSYDLFKKIFQSDERTMELIKRQVSIISDSRVANNAAMLLDDGVPESKVALLLLRKPLSVNLQSETFKKVVEEVKELGFNPLKSDFVIALHIKIIMSESSWKRKIDLFKRWGWSEDAIVSAFSKHPWCMVVSEGKIEKIMEFFVISKGWDSMEIAKYPKLLSYSLQKRILPRVSVIQFLQSNGLIRKNARHYAAFLMPEKLFVQQYVDSFKDNAPQLLKLYAKEQNVSKK